MSSFSPLQLQNAQQAVLEKNAIVSTARDELDASKQRMESLSVQLQQYQEEVSPVCGKTSDK